MAKHSFENKVALVTGASRGLGPFIAQALAARGCKLALTARSLEGLEQTAAKLRESGAEVVVIKSDLLDSDNRRNLPLRAISLLGPIDYLINNAGLEEVVAFDKQNVDSIEAIINTNLLAPLLLARNVLPDMLERGSGHIVNIASLAGRAGMPFGSVYAASKAGLTEWTLSVNSEINDHGVFASAVCPGFVGDAGMFARKKQRPPKMLGQSTPQDVADAVIRSIEKRLPEVFVNPTPVRPMVVLKNSAPKTYAWFGKKAGLVKALKRVAEKQARNA